MIASNVPQEWTVEGWLSFLQNETALLRRPGHHHKVLVKGAHALHRAQLINRDGLSDLLERADSALEYAVEALLDEPNDQ